MRKPAAMSNSQIAKQRRNTVSSFASSKRLNSMTAASKLIPDILSELNQQNIKNPRTGKPYSSRTIYADLAETIGVWSYVKPNWQARVLLNIDSVAKDVVFWDSLRRGLAPGFEVSGPSFCLPATQTITSYVYGKGITAHLMETAVNAADARQRVNEAAISEANGKPLQNKRNAVKSSLTALPKAKPNPNNDDRVAWTNLQIQNMLKRNQAFLLAATVDLYCLGNQYIVINPDCTFSIASPETVTVEYSASDYRRPLRVIITTKTQTAKVQDTYTDTQRTVTIQYYDARGTQVHEYENLIGRIPIVHWPNDRSANEIYGRPIYEAGLPIMWRYDNLINNIIEGVTLLGTPIPAFVGLDNPEQTKQLNSEQYNYLDENGTQQTGWITRLDRQTGLYLGKGGDAKMLSTNVGFTKDSLDALRQLFLLWLNQTHIPELIWGGAINSSKASAETQMPPFIQYINFRRLMLEGQGADPALGIEANGGLLELIDIWLRTYKLLNPNIVVAPVHIEWPEVDIMNDQLRYMWGTYLSGTGKITDETTLRMSGYVKDPAAEVMKAAGKKVRPPQFDEYESKLRVARLEALKRSVDPGDDDGPPFSTDYVTPMIDLLKGGNANATNQVAMHQHADGAAMTGDEFDVNGPLFWLGMYGAGG